MSIVTPEVYSYQDTQHIHVYGESVVSSGLEVRDAVDGYGLISRGLLWELEAIWFDPELVDGITTSWSASDTVITTVWTDSNSSVTTSWNQVQFGYWGDYYPYS